MGTASLPCNVDSLDKVPLNPDPRKGPNLGLISTSCSGGAILPTTCCSALLSREQHQGSRAQPEQESQQCWLCHVLPLCPQRVRSPSKQEAGISQAPGARPPSPECWGAEGRQCCREMLRPHGPIPPQHGQLRGLPGGPPPRDPCCGAGCFLTSL